MSKRPTMPKTDPQNAARFEALLPVDTRISIRPMFGHRAAFVNGNMFAGTFGPDVVVRLDDRSRVELLAIPGARPFEPMKGRPMTGYALVPSAWVADDPETKAWLARAFAWVERLPPKTRTKQSTTRSGRSSRPLGKSRKTKR